MKFCQNILVIAVLLGATTIDAVKINNEISKEEKTESKFVKELKAQAKAYNDWKVCADVIKQLGMPGSCAK